MILRLFLLAAGWACLVGTAMAKKTPMPAHLQQCINGAAVTYQLHPRLLESIARVESGLNTQALSRDPDGGIGRGVMQIRHDLNRLDRYGVSTQDLMDPCVNVYVGAWVLANCFRRHGNTWNAVGCYNAKTPHKRAAYARRVYAELSRSHQ